MQLTEGHVTIRIRQADIPLIESIFESVQNTYKQKTRKEVALKIDQDNYHSADSCGGVDLLAARGNTFSKIILDSFTVIYVIFLYA